MVAVLDIHCGIDLAGLLVHTATAMAKCVTTCRVNSIFAKRVILRSILTLQQVRITAVQHDWIAFVIRVYRPSAKYMICCLIHCRVNRIARSNGTQLLFIADKDVFYSVNFLDDLAWKIPALTVSDSGKGRIGSVAVRRQIGTELGRKHIVVLRPVGQIGLFFSVGVDQLPHAEGLCLGIAIQYRLLRCIVLCHHRQLIQMIHEDGIAFGIVE
ncbi:hypothetical protein [Allofournierella massiliensis]|uniref:hypothetical protein n=1 Tax=Allofournierella massiliensis TaxID=1650663 RepID=UPI0024B1136D|nr:hypothetical protein [Fournierella massiliensis]